MPEDPANQPNVLTGQSTVSPPPTTEVPPVMPPNDFSSPPPQETGLPAGGAGMLITENPDTPPIISESQAPLIASPPSPPRSKAKIVGSILALLILVVGIPAGILLVSQSQEVRERAAECAEGTTYTVSGNVRDQDGNGKNGVTICLDPSSNGCSGAAFSAQTTGNGNYAIANVPAGGAGHNVYLDPQTLPSGFTVSSSVPNPKLIGPEICTDDGVSAIFIVVPSSTGGGGGGGETPAEEASCQSVDFFDNSGQRISRVEVGKTYEAQITMYNSSQNTWTQDSYQLTYPINPLAEPISGHAASKANDDRSARGWSMQVPLRLNSDIGSRNSVTFREQVGAPSEAGTYNFYWRMFKIGAGTFGGECETDVQVFATGGSTAGTTCPQTSGPNYYCATAANTTSLPNNGNGCTNVEVNSPSSGLQCAGDSYCYRCTSDGGGGGGGGSGTISAECRNIALYNAAGTRLAQAELVQLKAGDTVKIAVGGSTNNGSIDRARFKVNGSFQPDAGGAITKDPATNEFYINYQIPASITSFNIEAQLHHTDSNVGQGGWF